MNRYEDLSLDPFRTTDQLLKYLDLNPNKLIESYLESHTNSKRSGKPTVVKTIRGSDPMQLKLLWTQSVFHDCFFLKSHWEFLCHGINTKFQSFWAFRSKYWEKLYFPIGGSGLGPLKTRLIMILNKQTFGFRLGYGAQKKLNTSTFFSVHTFIESNFISNSSKPKSLNFL